jgi:hypothetical protein
MNAKVAVVGLLLAVASPAMADGPLGISMGDKPEDLGCERLKGDIGLYGCRTVPRPYDGGAIFAVTSTPTTGICTIYIRGQSIKTNSFGVQLREAVDTVAADLAEAYGTGKKIDVLLAGSIWKAPQHWLDGLRHKDREYKYVWSGAKLKHDISGIAAGAHFEGSGTGTVDIRFDFKNKAACEAEVKKAKAKAF